jgi:hypothetical protein
MRTLSSALVTELGLTVTRPGFLVDVAFSTPLRLSTLGAISFGGNAYAAGAVRVAGLSWDGRASQSGALHFDNLDNALSAFLLNEGIAGRAINVFAVYAGATASGDIVQAFAGQGKLFELDPDGGMAVVQIVTGKANALYAPRSFINKANGFNYLDPSGKIYYVGGQKYRLERQVV